MIRRPPRSTPGHSSAASDVYKRQELMWPKIGWKKEGLWTRYPGSFCWSLDAPDGHMPLINQLRGVRLMDSILRHPAIAERHNNIL